MLIQEYIDALTSRVDPALTNTYRRLRSWTPTYTRRKMLSVSLDLDYLSGTKNGSQLISSIRRGSTLDCHICVDSKFPSEPSSKYCSVYPTFVPRTTDPLGTYPLDTSMVTGKNSNHITNIPFYNCILLNDFSSKVSNRAPLVLTVTRCLV